MMHFPANGVAINFLAIYHARTNTVMTSDLVLAQRFTAHLNDNGILLADLSKALKH